MTARVAILGLVPMLLEPDVGAETQRPLAAVLIGVLAPQRYLHLCYFFVLVSAGLNFY
jgi:cobalt-zinc-cadmium resistance protein CzcA